MTWKELDIGFESVLDDAMSLALEASDHVIDPKTRDSLPDSAFGVVYHDDKGNATRKYPLIVKNDPVATQKLVQKAIQFFNYCRPDWKEQLAAKIMSVIEENKLDISVNKNSSVLKYLHRKKLPPTLKVVSTPNEK